MKKKVWITALVGIIGVGAAVAVADEDNINFANNSNQLSIEEIEKKALSEVNGTIKDIELDNGVFKNYYEVEVITEDAEYDLKMNAKTGEVVRKNKEFLDYEDRLNVNSPKNNSGTTQLDGTTGNEIP